MKDFDFDELDRAVNSLAGATGKPAVSDKGESNVEVTKSIDATATVSDQISVRRKPAPSPAVQRSGGRFMDMVASAPRPQVSSLAQPALTIPVQPGVINADMSPEATDDGPADNVQPAGASTPTAQPATPSVTTSSVINLKSDPDVLTPEERALDSPFLSNATVEKRPLGAFSETSVSDATDDQDDAPYSPPSSSATLPAELSDDILLLESDIVEDTVTPAKVTESPKKADDTQASTQTSIIQQYKEQPNSVDQPSGAIYDTENYHKPLKYPTKRKTGWLVVLWIALLLVFGAGAGVGVYFFVLPQLL